MGHAIDHDKLADNTPIIVGAAQHTERLAENARPPFSSPVQLASNATRAALNDAGIEHAAADIDTIAVIRNFSDSPGAWRCPFGTSSNPPQSIAQRIGASPAHRIHSSAGGNQPQLLVAEIFSAIARGEKELAVLAGAEAIANQRFAERNGLEDNWQEDFDLPLDDRVDRYRYASPEEIRSGMSVPVHYYALIENLQAHQLGHNPQQHRHHMAQLLAPFSEVAASNPYSQNPRSYSAEELAETGPGNFLISLPYSKLLVAQDAVNQAAALVLTSIGKARQLGIDPGQWIFVQGYAQGSELCVINRENPARSSVMENVLQAALQQARASASDMDLIDIYSCFPCAVDAACRVLKLPTDGSGKLTVTGGLPFFGGPGNNYTTHALAEMALRLRNGRGRGLVTANGGILTKHAAMVMANQPAAADTAPVNWGEIEISPMDARQSSAVAIADSPQQGSILTYTVIKARKGPDTAVIMGETANGERFMAHSQEDKITTSICEASPIGRAVSLVTEDDRHQFSFLN